MLIFGNHCDWERQFIEEHPELEGWMQRPEAALHLADRGCEIIPLGHAKRLGQLNVIHGEILTGIGNQGGAFPARKTVELYSGIVVAGHTHSPQSFPNISPVEHKKKHMAWINPILGACNSDYLRNRPTARLNGFSVVDLYANGCFNCFPVVVLNGRFAYGGKLYENAARAEDPRVQSRIGSPKRFMPMTDEEVRRLTDENLFDLLAHDDGITQQNAAFELHLRGSKFQVTPEFLKHRARIERDPSRPGLRTLAGRKQSSE